MDFIEFGDVKSVIVGLITAALTSLSVYLAKNGKYIKRMISDLLYKNDVSNVLNKINNLIGEEAFVLGSYRKLPNIKEKKFKIFDEEVERLSSLKRLSLKKEEMPNDPHAVVVNDVIWRDDPLEIEVDKIYFSQLCTLRDQGIYPEILSASALMICAETREILLHRRSTESATYPGYLHTFGGAYYPSKPRNEGDRCSIRRTVIREINEETSIAAPINQNDIFFCLKEKKTNFIQFLFVGCCINKFDKDFIKSNYEGNACWVSFDQLETLLKSEEKIVPTCRAALLLWLGMGTPGAKRDTFLARKNPRKLFEELVALNKP